MEAAADIFLDNVPLQRHWLTRFAAVVIDALIIGAVTYVLTYFFSFPAKVWYLGSFSGVIWVLYATVLEGAFSATLGKKLLGLEVISKIGPLDYKKTLVRNASKIFWPVFLFDFILGFATNGDPRQKYSDRMAKTTVVLGTYLEPRIPTDPPQAARQPQIHEYSGEKCRKCGEPTVHVEEDRYQCTKCGLIQ